MKKKKRDGPTYEDLKSGNLSLPEDIEEFMVVNTKNAMEKIVMEATVKDLDVRTEKILDMKRAVKYTKLSDSTLRRKIKSGDLKASIVGNKYVFRKSDLNQFLGKKQRHTPPPGYKPKAFVGDKPKDAKIKIAANSILPPSKSGRPKKKGGGE